MNTSVLLEYFKPKAIEEALGIAGEDSHWLAGGTELIPRVKNSAGQYSKIISVRRLPQLHGIMIDGEILRIGAATTLAEICNSDLVRQYAPELARVAGIIASPEVRAMATIGGNLCQETRCAYYNRPQGVHSVSPGDPCIKAGGRLCKVTNRESRCIAVYRGHLAPVLLAYGAHLEIHSLEGNRILEVGDLFNNDSLRPISLSKTELLGQVHVPLDRNVVFSIHTHRRSLDFPQLGVAIGHNLNSVQPNYRICYVGSKGAPVRLEELENAFNEGTPKTHWNELIHNNTKAIAFPPNVIRGGKHLKVMLPVFIQRIMSELESEAENGI